MTERTTLNPRQIRKLVVQLRDAGAYHVEVKPDGSVTADFNQPVQYIRTYPWYWQQPTWIGPSWDIRYGDNFMVPCSGNSVGTTIEAGSSSTLVTPEGDKTTSEMSASDLLDSMRVSSEVVDGEPSGTYTSLAGGGTRVTFTAH